MKKGLHFGALGGALPWERAFSLIKEMGYDGVELVMSPNGPFTPDTDDATILRIGHLCREEGIEIVGVTNAVLWHSPLTSHDPQKRQIGVRSLLRQTEVCSLLGTDSALIIPGYVGTSFLPSAEVVRYDIALERAFEGISAAVSQAEQLKVKMLIENVWNRMLLSPLEMRDFIDRFHSGWVGQYLDIGNVMLTGYPEHWIEILGHRIGRVHVKDFKRCVGTMDGFCDLQTGDVDYSAVMHNLQEIGYNQWLTVEMHHETGEAACQRACAALDQILSLREA